MSEKRSKYDTDPLDPDFARQTEEIWDGGETRVFGDTTTEKIGGATRPVSPVSPGDQARLNPEADAPTRRIDDAFAQSSYPSVFVPPAYQPPRQPAYQQPPQNFAQQTYAPPPARYAPSSPQRPVAGLGVGEKWVTALPYAPFYIGIVAAIIELLVVPRTEARARFHAAQGLALQLCLLVVSFALRFVGLISGSNVGRILFGIAALIFLVYSFFRVLRGDEYRIAPLSDATRWLDTKIDPKK